MERAPLPPELRERKSIPVCILLTIITLGIYGLIRAYSLCKKIRLTRGEAPEVVGEFLCLVFVPFYSIYWAYTRGKRLYEGIASRGMPASDNSIVYLILAIFELNIVTYALMQNDLNTVADSMG